MPTRHPCQLIGIPRKKVPGATALYDLLALHEFVENLLSVTVEVRGVASELG
jgi:hypothetical protein